MHPMEWMEFVIIIENLLQEAMLCCAMLIRGRPLNVWAKLIEWNGYETHQTPLLYVFVDLKVHNVQKNSYHFDCIDQ